MAVEPLFAAMILTSGQVDGLRMCYDRASNTPSKHCIVDGDTLLLNGENIRLKDFDTPEPQTNICGGAHEVALAKQASSRLLELLNANQ